METKRAFGLADRRLSQTVSANNNRSRLPTEVGAPEDRIKVALGECPDAPG